MLASIDREVQEREGVRRGLTNAEVDAVLDQIGAIRLYDEAGHPTRLGIIRGCTSERAREFLQLVPEYQRRLNLRHVARICAAMNEGRYVAGNGSVICFSRDCSLVDGQHRFTAQAQSGIIIDWLVCVVDDDAFSTIDAVNKPRSIRELTVIASGGEVRLAPSVLSALVWDAVEGDQAAADRLQRSERAEIAIAHPQREVARRLFEAARRPAPTAGLLLGALCCERVGGARAEQFFVDAFSNNHTSSPAKALANWIVSRKKSARYGAGAVVRDERDRAVHAWNAYVEGRDLTILKGTTGGVSPRPLRWGDA